MHVRRGRSISREEDAGENLDSKGAAICDNANGKKGGLKQQMDSRYSDDGVNNETLEHPTINPSMQEEMHENLNHCENSEHEHDDDGYQEQTDEHIETGGVRQSECALLVEWLVETKGLSAKIVAKKAILAPEEFYAPELANMAAMTIHKNWDGVYEQCATLNDHDADMLYGRLTELERRADQEERRRQDE